MTSEPERGISPERGIHATEEDVNEQADEQADEQAEQDKESKDVETE